MHGPRIATRRCGPAPVSAGDGEVRPGGGFMASTARELVARRFQARRCNHRGPEGGVDWAGTVDRGRDASDIFPVQLEVGASALGASAFSSFAQSLMGTWHRTTGHGSGDGSGRMLDAFGQSGRLEGSSPGAGFRRCCACRGHRRGSFGQDREPRNRGGQRPHPPSARVVNCTGEGTGRSNVVNFAGGFPVLDNRLVAGPAGQSAQRFRCGGDWGLGLRTKPRRVWSTGVAEGRTETLGDE